MMRYCSAAWGWVLSNGSRGSRPGSAATCCGRRARGPPLAAVRFPPVARHQPPARAGSQAERLPRRRRVLPSSVARMMLLASFSVLFCSASNTLLMNARPACYSASLSLANHFEKNDERAAPARPRRFLRMGMVSGGARDEVVRGRRRRRRAQQIQVPGGLHHVAALDRARGFGEGQQQRVVADCIDGAGNAARPPGHAAQRFRGERRLAPAARLAPAVPHVVLDLRFGKRAEGKTQRDALLELAQVLAVEKLRELVLPQQHDLQQLALMVLEVAQQPDFLQHLGTEAVRLVHDQRHHPALGARLHQQFQQLVQALRLAGGHLFNAEVEQQQFQKFSRGERGVENYRRLNPAGGHGLQHFYEDGGLPRACVADHGDETFAVEDGVHEARQRLPVLRQSGTGTPDRGSC